MKIYQSNQNRQLNTMNLTEIMRYSLLRHYYTLNKYATNAFKQTSRCLYEIPLLLIKECILICEYNIKMSK